MGIRSGKGKGEKDEFESWKNQEEQMNNGERDGKGREAL